VATQEIKGSLELHFAFRFQPIQAALLIEKVLGSLLERRPSGGY
jgi:hypothetical protein